MTKRPSSSVGTGRTKIALRANDTEGAAGGRWRSRLGVNDMTTKGDTAGG